MIKSCFKILKHNFRYKIIERGQEHDKNTIKSCFKSYPK